MTKKINYNNPTFWASIDRSEDKDHHFCTRWSYRIRVIYPDGECVYSDSPYMCDHKWTSVSCFYENGMTHKEVIKAMKQFDKENNRKTTYLGQITLKGEE